MKLRHPLDMEIKNRMEPFTPSVPDHIWENIAAKKDKKRPFLFIWWNDYGKLSLMFAVLLLSGFISYKVFSSRNERQKVNEKVAGKNIIVSNQTISTEARQQKSFTKTQKVSLNEVVTGNSNQVNSNIQPIEGIDNTDFSIAHASERIILNDNTSVTNLKRSSKLKTSSNQKSVSNNTKISSKSNTHPFDSETTQSGPNDAETLLQPVVTSHQSILLQSTLNTQLKSINTSTLTIPCPVNKPSGQKSYLDVYVSPDYVFRQFKDTPHSSYLISRKTSTAFSSAFSAGLRYTKVFSNGLSLSAGLNFSQINEKFSYSQGNIINEQYIINANGDTIGSYHIVSTLYKTTYNRYRTLDIPLTIGYEKCGEKWDIGFNSGLMVNIHSWNKGEVLNAALQPVDISKKDNSNPYGFKSNIGIGGMAGMRLVYKWHENTGLFAEPYLRYNFSSMNSDAISLKQKYHTSGIRFGIRMRL